MRGKVMEVSNEDFSIIKPEVKIENEFLEIANDFGDPLEVIREAISNSIDANATRLNIKISIDDESGDDVLVITFSDNGDGMSYEQLAYNFWNLGDSYSKSFEGRIGEKGHGTKIYLRSEYIEVITCTGEKAYKSICEQPFKQLRKGKLHQPQIKQISVDGLERGTTITLSGYSKEFSRYKQDIIRDYIYWFTKLGSVECEFLKNPPVNFEIGLNVFENEYEILEFGHKFAKENKDTNKLIDKYNVEAAEYFCKKYIYENKTLDKYPYVTYDVVIYVEGDTAKREYNKMLGSRASKNGKYKVADRYGIWLCKDYIPIQRVNEWVSGFGRGSNAYLMLHGFINCQKFRLTANRGTIANTDIEIQESLKQEVQEILKEINEDLYKNDLDTLQKWKEEERTNTIEVLEYSKRKKRIIESKKLELISGSNTIRVIEPKNESELALLFNTIYTLYPDQFGFEPLDYNTSVGVDIIARNSCQGQVVESEYYYAELKYELTSKKEFNHSFKNIRWIICWDFDKTIKDGTELTCAVDQTKRRVRICEINNKKNYFLDDDVSGIRIKVIRLKELMERDLGLIFS